MSIYWNKNISVIFTEYKLPLLKTNIHQYFFLLDVVRRKKSFSLFYRKLFKYAFGLSIWGSH